MPHRRQILGKQGEDIAVRTLEDRGLRIITRNYRCRLGEIDVIAEDSDILIFIEVKTKSGTLFGLPQENVDFRKQVKIRKIAQFYLTETKQFHREISFWVAAVQLDREGNLINVEIFEDAF